MFFNISFQERRTRSAGSSPRPWSLNPEDGFTLVELVIAMVISMLVMGIVSTTLSFSVRLWERQKNRRVSDMPAVINLLRWQLANFDPVRVKTGEGNEARSVFVGDGTSIAFATDRSVKAISKGAPIVARYVFVKGQGVLLYAERPLDPYHPDDVGSFLEMKPGGDAAWPRFYATEVADFSLSYSGAAKEKEEVRDQLESWGDEEEGIPALVMVRWMDADGKSGSAEIMAPNSLFPVSKKTAEKERAGKGNKQQTPQQRPRGPTREN